MQLRDHPIFITRDLGSWWPPAWVKSQGERKTQHGEVGVLLEARCHDNIPNSIFMLIEYESDIYMGALLVKDTALWLQLHKRFPKLHRPHDQRDRRPRNRFSAITR